MACSWFPHCYCSAGGTSWGWLSCLNRGSMLLPQGGSEHDERTLCCAHCRPSPRAHSITPCQEDALGQGSMSWEEAELHKCTLIDPLNPPAGKQTPPHLQPKAAKHFTVASWDTQGEGGGSHRHMGPYHSAPGLPSVPSPWGEARAGSWHFRLFQATQLPLWS